MLSLEIALANLFIYSKKIFLALDKFKQCYTFLFGSSKTGNQKL